METMILRENVEKAAAFLLDGGLVAVPTETVYGLAANGLDARAVSRIYEVKGRPENKPVSILVGGMETVETFCREIPESAYLLAERFWPGPMTMILKKKENVPDIVTAGGDTVGVRCPDHPMTLEILRLAKVPLATPSANPSGMESPTDARMVWSYFAGKIPCIVDGGTCTVGLASTIVDLTGSVPKILRKGVLTAEMLSEALGGAKVL